MDDKIKRQIQLESEAVDLGVIRYRKDKPMPWRAEAATAKEETDLPPGKVLLSGAVEPVSEAIEAFVAHATEQSKGRHHSSLPFLRLIDPMQTAYIACRIAISSGSARTSIQNIALRIAGAIEHHLNTETFKKEAPGLYHVVGQQTKRATTNRHKTNVQRHAMSKAGIEKLEWSNTRKISLGMKLLELVIEVTGYVERTEIVNKRGKKMYSLGITEKTQSWLEKQHARCELLQPVCMPMIVKPREWRTPYEGGYLTKMIPNARLVKTYNTEYLDELGSVDMPEVYDAVNAVQSVAWSINKDVLNVMREVWDGQGNIGGLPSREDTPIPPRPHDIDTNPEALKAWKAAAAKIHAENGQLRSERLTISQKIWLAERFVDEEEIYFPHTLDFRGRVYPMVSYVNPQADDSGKALIRFAEGKPLGPVGAYWLAVHIANLFGHDKVPFDERMRWTVHHSNEIMDSALNPLDGEMFWTTADKPYCALAACLEWAGYIEQGDDFVSHIPVAMDGSNSGLQHFSAALRDPTGGHYVNLLPMDTPQDVYAEVMRVAQARADVSNDEEAAPWKGGKLTRSIAKRPTMTFCYAATKRGMCDQVLLEVKKIDTKRRLDGLPPLLGVDLNRTTCQWMGNTLYDSIGEVVVKAQEAMDWLKAAAKVASKAGLPFYWTTPLGLPVINEYKRQKGQRVVVNFLGDRIDLTVRVDGAVLDKKKQTSSVAPNWVHSLDASHLMKTVNACAKRGLTSIAVIHDSFGVHACDTGELGVLLRETFIDQYSGNVLADFRDEMLEQLPEEYREELPPAPAQGSLDLSKIRESSFIFA